VVPTLAARASPLASKLPGSIANVDKGIVLKGILLMIAGIFCLSAMDAGVRWLMLEGMSAVHLIAVRGWILLLVMTIWIWRRAGVHSLVTRRPWHHLIRAGFGMLSPLAFFVALKTVPLAEATAVFFCSVFLLTIGSSLFFGERVGLHRWGAVVVGFIGVLVVTQPGAESFKPQILLVLAASVLYCILILMGRWMSRTESTFSLVYYYNLALTMGYALVLPWFWQSMTGTEFSVLLLVSALALAGYFLLTHAFSVAPVSVVAPFEYSALAWATGFGWLLWGDLPASTTVIGIGLIVCSGMYIAWREHRIGTR
jgi:drug/metabolite transporter (DMT)-like permease